MMSGDDESNDSPPPSEVLWWGNEDEQGSDPIKQKEEVVSEFESEVSISTKEGPTLTGEVRSLSSSKDGDLFQAEDEAKAPGISKTAWFFIGLILAPFILGFVSFIMVVIGESLLDEDWFSDWDQDTTREDSVIINQVVHNVYRADLPDASSDLDIYGELYVSSEWNENGGCYFEIWQGETRIFEIVDDSDGNSWMAMECWSEGEDLDAFLKMEDGGVLFATQESEHPNSAQINGDFRGGSDSAGEFFLFLSFIIWPIGIVGGLIWGFVSGNSSFAWGMLSSLVVVPMVFLGLCAIFIIVFFGGGF